MKITIIGSGNIGTQFAVHSSKSNDVIIYTSTPEVICKNLKIVNENNEVILKSNNIIATKDEKIAFQDTDLIFVTYPSFLLDDIAKKIEPYAKKGLMIGLIPGTGGGECAFKKCIEKGSIIFGIQRVPSVARLVKKGEIVKAVGYRNELFVSSLPNKYSAKVANIVYDIFNIKTTILPNYLNLTLTPSNPVLHTTRLKTIFKDYKVGKFYTELPLFYEGWDNETSELLFKCDDEVQNICKELKEFDLSYVKSLKEHYESYTVQDLTNKIRSIEGFKGLTTPSIDIEGKLIPDLNSRYFTADFSFGLSILIQIGELLNLKIVNLKQTMNWYKKIALDNNQFDYTNYDINNKKDFINFYSL